MGRARKTEAVYKTTSPRGVLVAESGSRVLSILREQRVKWLVTRDRAPAKRGFLRYGCQEESVGRFRLGLEAQLSICCEFQKQHIQFGYCFSKKRALVRQLGAQRVELPEVSRWFGLRLGREEVEYVLLDFCRAAFEACTVSVRNESKSGSQLVLDYRARDAYLAKCLKTIYLRYGRKRPSIRSV